MKIDFKSIVPHLIALLIFLGLSTFYFMPQLEGKKVNQPDIVSWKGMAQESRQFKKETGEYTLWTDAMFGGMPTYQISSPQPYNIGLYFKKVLTLGIPRPIGMFLLGLLGFYITLILFGVDYRIAIIGAIAFVFSTNNMVLYEAGHMSKIWAAMMAAPIIGGVILAYRGKLNIGLILFGMAMAINLSANHVQMTYYVAMMLVILVIIELVNAIRQHRFKSFLRATLGLALVSALALGTFSSKLLPSYEYAKDTMRGDPILNASSATPKSSSETKGLEWNYAMGWSNGFVDLLSHYIPGVVGGSSQEKISKDSFTAKEFKKYGQKIPVAPLYWGGLTSTAGAPYLGAITIFLFVLGLITVRGPLKWWFGSAFALILMLSLGKNLEWFNHFLFDYLPMFNKFRAPNSVITVGSVPVMLFAFLTLYKIVDGQIEKPLLLKGLYISAGILGLISLFFATIGHSFFDMVGPYDARYKSQGLDTSVFVKDRIALMHSDAFRSLIFLLLGAGLVYGFIKEKIQASWLILGIGLLTLVDLIPVDKRYLENDDFITERKLNKAFIPSAVDKQIMKDKDPDFRVYDTSPNSFSSSRASYFYKTIGGYHAAKLQRYQDLIDRQLSKGNMSVFNMLNTKYFIVNNPTTKQQEVQQNPGALGNAWFVSSIKIVPTANKEIDGLNDLDTKEVALVNEEFKDYVKDLNLQKNGSIFLTKYAPNKIEYQSNATSDQLAVFSEIWYGPNKGWQAYIDGKPVDHIRVNYVLRGLKVPAGKHVIKFVFDPQIYKTSNTISLVSSLLLMLLMGWMGFREWKIRIQKA